MYIVLKSIKFVIGMIILILLVAMGGRIIGFLRGEEFRQDEILFTLILYVFLTPLVVVLWFILKNIIKKYDTKHGGEQ